jgi:hypothetical protein
MRIEKIKIFKVYIVFIIKSNQILHYVKIITFIKYFCKKLLE